MAQKSQHGYRTLGKNEYVYFADQEADAIYFVAKGRVKIFHTAVSGKPVVQSILSSGELFGELALADEERRTDFAQAMDDSTTLCVWKLADLKGVLLSDQELSFQLVKLMGLRAHKLQRKVELLLFKDTRTRVIEFLKDAAAWKGRKVGTETLIMTPLTHGDIARLVGLSRQSVSTVMNQLKEENAIYFDRRRILIRDIMTL